MSTVSQSALAGPTRLASPWGTALLLLLGASAAWAGGDTSGVVVRLESGGQKLSGQVVVELTPEGESAVEVVLNDGGERPDVNAGDGTWAGATSIVGHSYTVRVKVDGDTIDAGKASWSPEDRTRDLDVRLSGKSATAEASVARAPGTGPGNGPNPGGPAGGTPTAPGGAPGGAPGAAPGAMGGSGGEGGAMLFIGLAGGLALLFGVAWAWVRSRGEGGGGRRPRDLETLPEAGLLGEGTPSLSEGVSVWVAEEASRPAAAAMILELLARHHRVLVAGADPMELPPVAGGPVYRAESTRAGEIGDTAEALSASPGAPVAVLHLGPFEDARVLKELGEQLPEGIGAVALLPGALGEEPPNVVLTAAEDGWGVASAGCTLALRATSEGWSAEELRQEAG